MKINYCTVALLLFHFVAIETVSCEYTYMQGLYESLNEAQKSMKSMMYNMKEGMKTLGSTVKFVHRFIDSTIEEDCNYHCPPERMLVPRRGFKPESNGCGSLGVHFEEMLPQAEMVNCCNEHDLCYSVCGSEKDLCDLAFKKCLYQTCNRKMNFIDTKACKASAKLLYTGTMALGCTSFLDAQEEACECVLIHNTDL